MSASSDAVKRWRKSTKEKIVSVLGGKCQVCGYNKCMSALEMHHLDPSKKSFGLGYIMSHPCSWDKLIPEMNKCLLLCANCHRELHDGLLDPNLIKRIEIKTISDEMVYEICPVCGGKMPPGRKTCSRKCSAKRGHVVDWDSIDLKEELKVKSRTEIADSLGVTVMAVNKRMKKLGIPVEKPKFASLKSVDLSEYSKKYTNRQIANMFGCSERAVATEIARQHAYRR